MIIRPFGEPDRQAVVHLWKLCDLVVPWNDPDKDIQRKLSQQPDLFFVAVAEGPGNESAVVGTVMAGYDGHRGWINYLAVHPEHRKAGIGRGLMDEAESHLRALGCPKINLQVRPSNMRVVAYYEHLGFKIEDVVNMGKRLEADTAG